ncbi:MAG TPA: hypothetical protein VK906_09555 [Egicoccus sp.]|nr:hypothetical protein [Egicoccus sp.]HSK23410.1 hypothetical protein [Egicoccus sp.]
MSGAYERVKPVVDRLSDRFYDLLAACDEYDDLLATLSDEEQASSDPNPELVRRYAHQQREVGELRDGLESDAMDTLLRIVDRILMIKKTEDGEFL